MISINDDKQALLWFYERYSRLCKGHSSKQKKISSQIDQMVKSIDKHLPRNGSCRSSSKRANSIAQLNNTYRWYCRVHKHLPNLSDRRLNEAVYRLLDFLSSDGAERLSEARSSIINADNISIYELLYDNKEILNTMTSDPAACFIALLKEKAAKDSLSTLSSSQRIVCVTKTGKLYHRTSCPYCKGHDIRTLSYEDASADGYIPCRCIGKNAMNIYSSNVPTVSDSRILSSAVTVFIDESSIPNPWKWLDEDLSNMQGSYSYIICEGFLSSEEEISALNTIASNACASRWSNTTSTSSIEAIATVLEVLAFQYEFHSHVKIYTDNKSIVQQWEDNPVSTNLSLQFKQVSVEYIPRELNRHADALLKQHVFSELPKSSMGWIKKAVQEDVSTREELEYVHAFFPDTRKDIPRLIESLERLAHMTGYNPYNTVPDMAPDDRLRLLLSMINAGLKKAKSLEKNHI